jgi:hypothetical protein
MISMKLLLYSHERVLSLAGAAFSWLYGRVVSWADQHRTLAPRGTRTRRLLSVGFVVVVLVAEAVMLVMLAQLVDLCLSLMEVWAELAAKHLEITLDRTP